MIFYHCDQGPIKDGQIWDRTTLINHCIRKCGYNSYLEIGYGHGRNWNKIQIENKTCVDPFRGPSEVIKQTSDQFFEKNKQTFDIIFIDGDHSAEQVYKDIINGLACLNHDGTILTHDNSPPAAIHEIGSTCGTSWRTIPFIRKRTDLDICTFVGDLGVGIIKKRENQNLLTVGLDDEISRFLSMKNPNFDLISYDMLEKRRVELLNLLSLDEILEWL